MNLHDQIPLRKSCRKYSQDPLPSEVLAEIEAFIPTMQPLLPDVVINHRIVGPRDVRGLLAPKAPHFVVISGKQHPHRDLCAGFLFQQLDLYLSACGLGCCWLGVTKGKESPFGEDDILAICFGTPIGPATRMRSECKRKPLAEIATGTDPRLEAARLAPSGRNLQPWHFIVESGNIHAYYQAPGKLWGLLYTLQPLDLGIALCHLYLATKAAGIPFQFDPAYPKAPKAPSGFAYVGTVC
ncbi:MAG: hypothetical protein FWE28_04645 [Oscillospiraceae bacterium]|nr:hypothetical protein [Oscillospiraceae bacterium]